jgi:hypothetical protein
VVELLVEAVDGLLVEQADGEPLAVGAAQLDLPLRLGGLFPLDGIHEVLVALRADVEVGVLARDARGGLRRVRRLVLEVDDLDGTPGRQDHAADVVGVVRMAHGGSGGARWGLRPTSVCQRGT